MSSQVNNAFITQWNDEVKQAYQQKGSKLRQSVRVVTGVTGDTYKFHKLGAVSANTKTRDADLTFLDPTHTTVSATLADAYAPIHLDKLDETKTNVSMRNEFVIAASNALGRKTDSVINTALLASNTNGTTLTGGLTLAKIIEGLVLLNSVDADPMDRFLIVSPYQIGEALQIQGLTVND